MYVVYEICLIFLGVPALKKGYIHSMFVRKKKNPSGVVSVQVIDKSSGKYRVVKTIGSSSDPKEIAGLHEEGQKWISDRVYGGDIFDHKATDEEEEQVVRRVLSNVDNVLINGTEKILDRVYKRIGFDTIDNQILKYLVIARLGQPMSKSATVDYLKSHFDEDIDLNRIYRYMDELNNTQQERIQRISVSHTRELLGNKIGLLFYDVTTLYFETDKRDELREKGFSKDGKHSQSQVVLGLLVSKEGYPLSYSLFNGSQYEGRTMLPVLEDFIQRFELEDFVIVADSGLMNKTNITLLKQQGYKYIIGARIKNESNKIKEWILTLEKEKGKFFEREKSDDRLIVGYSDKRAKKDRYNRQKGIERLEKAFKRGKITKDKINKRGYNKFLELTNDVEVRINRQKIKDDEKWDGLKGYITNTDLPAKEVYNQYNGLWIIEKAFRITKGTLQIRPMFHFTPRRIEAHVCICFVAYKVYKELERILRASQFEISADKVLSIAKTITTIRVKLPSSDRILEKTMLLTDEHRSIERLFDDRFWQTLDNSN